MSAQDELRERIAELESYIRQAAERMMRADSAERANAALGRAVTLLRVFAAQGEPSSDAYVEMDAILADAESSTAADEYKREQEERAELEALARNMANPGMLMGSLAESWITMHRMRAREILAKIDARRNGTPRE